MSTRVAARAASLRQLHQLMGAVNGDLDLDRTLAAVCRGVVEGLGFGVAAVNLVRPDGALEVVAVAGHAGAGALLGQSASRGLWDRWLEACTPVGGLLVDYQHTSSGGSIPSWVPDLPPSDEEDAWTAEDVLLAPLRTSSSGLLGVISVDLPEDGLRPGPEQLELLEMYAAQASVALENASLHSTLRARDEARSRALGRLTAIVDSAPVAIVELDLEGRVRLWNGAAEQIFGWSADEVLGRRNPVAPVEEYETYLQVLRRDGVLHRRESSRVRRDGTRVDLEMTSSALLDATGQVYGYLGVYVDVSHRRQLEQDLRAAAYTDPLTGLANRAHFTALLTVVGREVNLVLIDLDGFKEVNDSFGHPVGDQVLIEVARRLRSVCRDEDLVARLGGDEFVVLLTPSADDPDAETAGRTLSRRLLEVLAAPFEAGDRLLTLSASVGLAHAADPGGLDGTGPVEAGQALLRDADVALYAAKAGGKGRMQVFEPALREAVVERAELLGDLRAGLAGGEMFLRWHPVAEVRTGRIVGLEALARWQHPQRGELLPATFCGLAEETGLIVPLGAAALTQACRALQGWQDLPGAAGSGRPLSVSVNLSPVQVLADGLVDTVRDVLLETGVRPRSLVFELTEDVLLRDVDQAVAVLDQLRALGVRLAVDDFGTGYSSLSYLTRLPLDMVKLDRSLLRDAGRNPASLALFDGVVALTRRLGLTTVAEGVETREQWALLQHLGVPLAQGYLLAKPLLAADVPALLARGVPERAAGGADG